MPAPIQEGQYTELSNGTRLHYASAGEKGRPLILFVHGFPEFWYEWAAQLVEFGNDFYAVAPDLRGFNLSDMPLDVAAYKPKHIVDDLRLLIGHLGYERCILVAHDWGGAIAWNLAIAMPQLIEKLAIVNSPHPYLFARDLASDPEQQAASQYMNWLRAEGSEQALGEDGFARVEGMLTSMSPPPFAWFTTEVRARYHACWSRGLRGGVNYYRASPLHPSTGREPGAAALNLNPDDFRVRVPTMVIWGERDTALRPGLLNGLEDVVDQLTLHRIPEGSHWIIHEQPERINGLLREFIGNRS